MLATLQPYQATPVIGRVLQWYLTFNSGAAFSMGAAWTPIFPVLALLVLIAVLCYALPRLRLGWWATALGLLIGGILGNLYDRLFRAPGPFRGEVVDFIMLPKFAIFNIADICICTSAGLFIVLTIWGKYALDGSLAKEKS